MFKVPDWTEDVPKNKANSLGKKINKKQQKLAVKVPPSPKKIKKRNAKEKPTNVNDIKNTDFLQKKQQKLAVKLPPFPKKLKKRNAKEKPVANENDIKNTDFLQRKQQKLAVKLPPSPKKLKKTNAKVKPTNENAIKNTVFLQKKQQKLTVKLPPNTNAKENLASNENDIKNLAKKRKHNGAIIKNKKKSDTIDVSNVDTDNLDEALLNAKKKKFYEPMKKDDVEHLLFQEEGEKVANKLSTNGKKVEKIIGNKINKKKILNKRNVVEPEAPIKKVFQVKANINSEVSNMNEGSLDKRKGKLKAVLKSHRNTISVRGIKLRERMLDRLKAAQFRYINEKLYTSSGLEAKDMFQNDPAAFTTYHRGYQQQVKKWPVNPLHVIAKRIQEMPKTHIIADMGCGEAALSRRLPHKVRSFDLVSSAPGVEICDMARTPLLAASMDVAVYCLALMGTELTQYLVEANRILKMGGHLLIAEVESRFTDVDAFTKEVSRLGFKLKELDKQHQVFFFMEFIKVGGPPVKKNKLPELTLKPCLYKKR